MNRARKLHISGVLALVLVGIFVLTSVASAAPQKPTGTGHSVPVPASVRALKASPASLGQRTGKQPKLGSGVAEVAREARVSRDKGLDEAKSRGLRTSGDRLQVYVTTLSGQEPGVVAAIKAAGGEVTKTGSKSALIQAWLPVDAIDRVAASSAVVTISRPNVAIPDEGTVTTEGAAVAGVPDWHTTGYRGEGTKVAIVDAGFQGYSSLLGSDLPASVTIKNFVDDETDSQVDGTTDHGTACAEIVHDMAPDAQIYLVKVDTSLDLQQAVDYLGGQGVDVISTSLSWLNAGPGDGTGFLPDLVAQAREHGIAWVTSAGNYRLNHFGAAFYDYNGYGESNGWHNFGSTGYGDQEINFFGPGDHDTAYKIPAGQTIHIYLRWADWQSVNVDLDLYLFRLRDDGSDWDLVAWSENPQSGQTGQTPTEEIEYVTTGADAVYGYGVFGNNTSWSGPGFDVFIPGMPPTDYLTMSGSISSPSDSPYVTSVGAVDVESPYKQEEYSSEGPNGAGLIKPDIAAYANVSTVTYGTGNFSGTSAATPHVAGAAALVAGAYPAYTPDQIKDYLTQHAADLGPGGKDNQYGSGRLNLLPVPPPRPRITGVTPNSGAVGSAVVLTGTGFNDLISVKFSGVRAPLDQIYGPSQVRVWVPVGASSGPITLTTPMGSATSATNFTVTGSQLFADAAAGLAEVSRGSAAWGDYDGDGDLDVLLNGTLHPVYGGFLTKVYRNDGGGVFTDIGANIIGTDLGSVAWGDYDGDGDLDVLVTGALDTNRSISRVYRNDGGNFVDIGANLIGVSLGSSTWGDYDNDGDLDILLTGRARLNSGREADVARVYRNDRGTFVDTGANLTGVWSGSGAWGDYDKDGDLDILITGSAGDADISKVYRNDGGTFVDSGMSLAGVNQGSGSWGDYDNDGDLDILITGVSRSAGSYAKIYRNDGGAFVDIAAALPAGDVGPSAWGDYDNDGDLDILIVNTAGGIPVSKVFRNDGGGTFADVPDANVLGSNFDTGSAAWGDYGNDGKLDLLITGYSSTWSVGGYSRVYRNLGQASNTPPTVPSGLNAAIQGNSATLTWNASTDAKTPAAGLTYNVRVGTTPGGSEIMSAMALGSGYRRVPAPGNVSQDRSWALSNLPGGTYYWSVQAIDSAFAGSAFAAEKSFTIANTCYTLTLGHTGSGADPTASPAKSAACPTNGQYVVGEHVSLAANPADGFEVLSWTGIDFGPRAALTGSLTMPGSNRTVSVAYDVPCAGVPEGAVCAQYYNNTTLSGHAFYSEIESYPIYHQWGLGGPGGGIGNDNFSARYSGTFQFATTGVYRFDADTADDGARLWVDGVLVIDQWHAQAGHLYSAAVPLVAGSHTIKFECYEHLNNASATLGWSLDVGVGFARGNYWLTVTPPAEGTGSTGSETSAWPPLDRNWGTSGPYGPFYPDNYSARWVGTFRIAAANTYAFVATADDGVRVWVDGKLIIDGWKDQGPTTYRGDVPLAAGDHTVRMDYYEHTGGAEMHLNWSVVAPCYSLTLAHTGGGTDPTASPSKSASCASAGQYVEGEKITLTAHPAATYAVSAWTGTDDDASKALTNVLTMPASARTVSATYARPCYVLALSRQGNGGNPTASPASSADCPTGQYAEGETVTLTAHPDPGNQVSEWTGTNNDWSNSATNTLTMPGAIRSVTVIYIVPPQMTLLPQPVRVVDTRPNLPYLGSGKPLTGTADSHCFQLTGQAGVPSNATAVVVNLTAVGYSRDGWIAAYPYNPAYPASSQPEPKTSSLNFDTQENAIANSAIVALGSGGQVCLTASSYTNAIVDVTGYLVQVAEPQSQVKLLGSPQRVVDTRPNLPYQGSGKPLNGYASHTRFKIAEKGGVPAGATAVLVNLTAVGYKADGWLSAYPACTAQPSTSNVNFDTVENAIAGFAVVKLGVASAGPDCQGAIDVTGAPNTNVIVDVTGYLVQVNDPQIVLLDSPKRIVDTRVSLPYDGSGKPLDGNTNNPRPFLMAGQGGVPTTAKGVIANLTTVGYKADGWVAAYPTGGSIPVTSSVNFDPDENAIANTAILRLGAGGQVSLVACAPTNAIIDVSAYLVR